MWEAVCRTQGCGWSSRDALLLQVQSAANLHEQAHPGHQVAEREIPEARIRPSVRDPR